MTEPTAGTAGTPGTPGTEQAAEWQRLDKRMLLIHPIQTFIRALPALLAIFVDVSNGDAGTDGTDPPAPTDAGAHHGVGELATLLSLGLSAREGWKLGRRYLAKRQRPPSPPTPEIAHDTATTAGELTPPADTPQALAAEFEGTHHDQVLTYGRRQTARHFTLPEEQLENVYYEFAVEEAAWRLDFQGSPSAIYHVAIKSNGSIMRAVNYQMTRL